MQRSRRVGWISGALVCGLSTWALAAPAAPGASVSAEIAALKAEVAQMRAERGENWLNERRAQEIKALVREVLQDADTRASLQSGGMTAGHNGKNFFLASEDGSFLLNIGMRAQFRYIANLRNDSGADDAETGFQLRRLKPRFSGFVADPKITYNIVLAANRNDDAFGLEEVKLGYQIFDNLTLEGGRYKAPFLREELTSSGKQLAVERSLVNELFTMGFAEGVGVTWEASPMMKVAAMFNDGQNSGEIGGTGDDFHNDLVDYAGTARVDLKLAGNWKQMEDFTAWQGEPLGLFVGAAIHAEQAETGNLGAGDNGYFVAWTVDGSFENEGWGVYGAIINKMIHGDSYNYDQWGALAQLSYNLDDHLEPFIRWEWYKGGGALLNTTGGIGGYSTPAAGQKDNAQLVTIGANYYLKKHNAKFTADVVWAPDPLYLGSSGVTGLGLLGDSTGNRDQIVIRGQFQLEF